MRWEGLVFFREYVLCLFPDCGYGLQDADGADGLGYIVDTEDGGTALKCCEVQHLCLRQGFFGGDVQQTVDHAFAGYTDKYGPSQGGEAVQMGEQLIILLYAGSRIQLRMPYCSALSPNFLKYSRTSSTTSSYWQSDCMVCGLPRLCIATYSSPSLPTAGSI